MKYIRLRVWVLFFVLIVGFIFLIRSSIHSTEIYKSTAPVENKQITSTYPDLYAAIANRDAQRLKNYLSHDHQQVREQAWRALANTPVDSVGSYIKLAAEQNTEQAWFAVSQQNLPKNNLRRLEEIWDNDSAAKEGIATVLGQQGDAQSLDFLLARMDTTNLKNETPFALAVGRLLTRHKTTTGEQISIIQQAFQAEQDHTTRAYLYGWYRNTDQSLTNVAQDTLFTRWQVFGVGTSAGVDQFINRLLTGRTTYRMALYYNGEQELEDHTQLSVELANSIGELELDSKTALAAKFLLSHPNPHVQEQTLQSISGKINKGDNLYRYISRTMIANDDLADMVWLQALETAIPSGYALEKVNKERLQAISDQKPHLLPDVLAVYARQEAPEEFLQRLENIISKKDTASTGYALEGLYAYWQSLSEDERDSVQIEKVRTITLKALDYGDRRVTSTASTLIESEELFHKEYFPEINASLASFSLPEDLEVYQAFGALYKQRFEEQARPVIDSLASLEYLPLNRSLAESGWSVPVNEEASVTVRLPNWERLWELGRDPVWTLQTEKGVIRVQLNTLSAPATVSMIDSLSRAGAYDEVPFHRVVPNFVIQGGDIERGDGFGGADFAIPTEASEKGFTRGAVGIASAGTDTESSQYFIMHQWKPHLNGNYTLVGEVIEGMDVVDRIVAGDKVLSSGW